MVHSYAHNPQNLQAFLMTIAVTDWGDKRSEIFMLELVEMFPATGGLVGSFDFCNVYVATCAAGVNGSTMLTLCGAPPVWAIYEQRKIVKLRVPR